MTDPQHTTSQTEDAPPTRSAQEVADDVVARVLARAGATLHAGAHGALVVRRRPARARGAHVAAPGRGAVHRARGRHRGRVPPAAAGEGRPRRRLGLRHRHRRRDLPARARRSSPRPPAPQVLDGLLQRRQKPDPGTYLGSGKAAELATLVAAVGADTVVVDGELAPSQRRALEDIVRVKVIDRTALILDIFAQHAKSREGKAQVELAQLEYLLPRLRGWGDSMSRQAGGQVGGAAAGMGSRGPGETKIELDRRRIRNRMAKLRREIAAMEPARVTKRRVAQEARDPVGRHRRLHQRGQVVAAQPADARGRARRERAVRDARPDRPPRRDRRRARSTRSRTRSASSARCRTSWSRRSAPPWRRSRTRT